MIKGTKYDGELKAGAAAVEAQGSDIYFSKACNPGTRYKTFWTIVESAHGGYSVAAATAYGYTLDYEKLGFSFALAPDTDETGNDGKRIDRSPLADLANISNVLYECRREADKENARDSAMSKAKRAGDTTIDEAALALAMQEIDVAYDGTTVNDVYVPPTENRLVDRAAQHIYASPVMVTVDKNGIPTTARVVRASMPVTGVKSKNLIAVVNEYAEAYQKEMLEDEFIEISYNYDASDTDKNICGQKAVFEIVKPGVRIRDVDSKWWDGVGGLQTIKALLLDTPDRIRARNKSVSNPPSINQVMLNFKKYCATNKDLANFLREDTPGIQFCADKLLELPHFIKRPDIKEMLEAIVADRASKNINATEGDITLEEASELAAATNIKDMHAAVKTRTLDEVFSGEGEDARGADVTDTAAIQAMMAEGELPSLEGTPV